MSSALKMIRGLAHRGSALNSPLNIGSNLAGRVIHSRYMSSSTVHKKYESLAVSSPSEFVVHVELNRPQQLNSVNNAMWRELKEVFSELSDDKDCRVVVLSGSGRLFCAGLDFKSVQETFIMNEEDDIARRCKNVYNVIKFCQAGITAIEKCAKPVISAVHGGCIGAGVDMVSTADIRMCSKDAWFQIKEIDLGMAADVGTLQRLPKAIGNRSLVNDLALTGRKMESTEAKECGFVSSVHSDKESLLKHAFEMAKVIAAKSPVAAQVTKKALLYARDHSVDDSLEQIAIYNQVMLQSEDFMNAAMAVATKSPPPTFSKL